MTALQMALSDPELATSALDSWYIFLQTLEPQDLGPHVGPSSAAMIGSWPHLSPAGRQLVHECLRLLVVGLGKDPGDHLDDMVDLQNLDELNEVHHKMLKRRRNFSEERRVVTMLNRASSDNSLVTLFALRELKWYMIGHREYFQALATGDNFNPIVGRILSIVLAAAAREGDGADDVRLVAYECIGALSAIDPDRFDLGDGDKRTVIVKNLTEIEESIRFASYLITDVLVGAFRSTGVIVYQTHIAYAIQSLLKFCNMTNARGQSLSLRARKAWGDMPKHVLDTVTPLINGRFVSNATPVAPQALPIYPTQTTYREWLPTWTGYLITRASGANAKAIFHPLQSAVQSQDVSVARQVVPHIVLNVLLSDNQGDVDAIRAEIVAVLEDQVNPESTSTKDKQLLSAQVGLWLDISSSGT
jgi:serine/threonine-protein kinase ATR